MNLSKPGYEKAKLMLSFIAEQPNCHIHEIAAEFGMLKAVAQVVVSQMVKAECIKFITRKHQGGRRHFYSVTGKPLPPRGQRLPDRHMEAITINQSPIEIDDFVRLPSFIRALTPVILPEARRSTTFTGHTIEQHKQQSAIIRKDRAKALRGAVSSGVSML